MSEHVTLLGAEQVERAAHAIREAAMMMENAANNLAVENMRHEQAMREIAESMNPYRGMETPDEPRCLACGYNPCRQSMTGCRGAR